MQIYGPTHVHGAQSISAPHTSRAAQSGSVARPAAASDQLELSEAGQLASRLSDVPDIRQDRVQAIRAALADGTYETPDKLSAALDHLLDEIG